MPLKKGKLMNNPNAISFKISFAEHFVVPACAGMTIARFTIRLPRIEDIIIT
jgi:hypothetical protein